MRYRLAPRPVVLSLAVFQFLFSLTSDSTAQTPSEGSCIELARLPIAVDQLYSDPLDNAHSNYLAIRHGSQTSIIRAERQPSGLFLSTVQTAASLPGSDISMAFIDGSISLARSEVQGVSPSSFVSSAQLTEVPAFSLTDGTQDLSLSFSDPSQSNQTALVSWPFWNGHPVYSPWEQYVCPGSGGTQGQLGRLITNIGDDSLVVANNFEFSSSYFDLPYSCGRQHYERNPDGSTKMRVAQNPNSPGFYCDITDPYPGLLGCQPTGDYSNPGCIDITPTPTATPTATATPGGTPPPTPTATPTPTPSPPPPQGCNVRMEPDPIELSEFCPTCPYYWWAMDPGFAIYNRAPNGTMVKGSSFTFPADFSTEHVTLPIPAGEFRLGEIMKLRPDSYSDGFAAAVDLSADAYPELSHMGGVFFFGAGGDYRGFASGFFENGRSGKTLSALGRFQDTSAYAIGSSESGIFHPESGEFPPEWESLFHPENGHMMFTTERGEFLGIYFGQAAGDRFGNSVTTLGDWNLDNKPEVAIGAPGGRYVAFATTALEIPATLQTLSQPEIPEFGSHVASLSTALNGIADVLAVAAASEIIFYDVASCVESLLPQIDPYRAQVLAHIDATLQTLDQVVIPEASVPNQASQSLVTLGFMLEYLYELLTDSELISDSNLVTSKLAGHHQGLTSALSTTESQNSEVMKLNNQELVLKKKIKKLKKKQKRQHRLSTKEYKNLKSAKKSVRKVQKKRKASFNQAQSSSQQASTSKGSLRAELLNLQAALKL